MERGNGWGGGDGDDMTSGVNLVPIEYLNQLPFTLNKWRPLQQTQTIQYRYSAIHLTTNNMLFFDETPNVIQSSRCICLVTKAFRAAKTLSSHLSHFLQKLVYM